MMIIHNSPSRSGVERAVAPVCPVKLSTSLLANALAPAKLSERGCVCFIKFATRDVRSSRGAGAEEGASLGTQQQLFI